MSEQESNLHIGDRCEVIAGVYAGIQVKIIDLPDKHDARYSAACDGFAGLRFHRKNLRLMDDGGKNGRTGINTAI